MAKLPETFNERLRWLRTSAHLTQPELVDRLAAMGVEIGRTYISELESTTREKVRKPPTGDVVAGLARVLGTTTDYLLCVSDNPEPPGADEGVGISPEAERIARLVDNLTPKRRAEAEKIVEVIAESAGQTQAAVTAAADELAVRIRAAGLPIGEAAVEEIRRLLVDYAAKISGLPNGGGGGETLRHKVGSNHLKHGSKQIVK